MDKPTIPYYFESIDRNAILIRPGKPFLEWVNAVYPDEREVSVIDENNIYLIREMDRNEDVMKWISRNFDKLFVNELNGWYTDQSVWPENRTYKMFCEWFDVEVHSMVLDLEDDPVMKE